MSHPYTPGMGYIPNMGLPSWLTDPQTDDDYARLYPGTGGNYTSTPENPSGMAESPLMPASTGRPGWAARLFGGADPLQQGLVDPSQANQFGRQALFQTGLSMLQNSGPSPFRRGLGEILATGIQSGQQAYQAGAQQALGQQGILAQRQSARRLEQLRQRYQGRNDPASQQAYLHDLIGLGTPEALAGARSLSEVIKSQQAPDAVRGQVITEMGPDGRPRQRVIDPTQIGQTFAPPPPQVSDAQRNAQDQRLFWRENALMDDWGRESKPWSDVYQLTQGAVQRTDQALAGDGAAQIEMLYAFVRALDPESVVREGEVALARSAASPYSQAKAMYQRWLEGKDVVVPPSLVRQMSGLMNQRATGLKNRYTASRQRYVTRAQRAGLSDAEGLFAPLQNYGAPEQAPAPGAPSLLAPRAPTRPVP